MPSLSAMSCVDWSYRQALASTVISTKVDISTRWIAAGKRVVGSGHGVSWELGDNTTRTAHEAAELCAFNGCKAARMSKYIRTALLERILRGSIIVNASAKEFPHQISR